MIHNVIRISQYSNFINTVCILHVGDVEDEIYINKRSKATLSRAVLLMSEMSKILNVSINDQRLCNYFHVEGVEDGDKYE